MELWQIWAVVAVVLFIIELFTPAFFVACFGIGAALAAIAAAVGMNVSWQLVFFAAGALVSFVLVRPFVLKYIKDHGKAVKTNADALIGRVGRVSQAIDNAAGTGRVMIDGDDWRAISSDDTVAIPVGQPVEVTHRDSIVLTVKPQ